MFTTLNANEHRLASLAHIPHGRVWRMVEIELPQLLFFPTWLATEDSITVHRRALLSDWDDTRTLLNAIGAKALSHLQCLYPPRDGLHFAKDGESELWQICTIKKALRAAQPEGFNEVKVVFEDTDGRQHLYPCAPKEPFTIAEQVWPA